MRKMNEFTKTIFEYLKTAKAIRTEFGNNGVLTIGTIFSHNYDYKYIVVGADIKSDSKLSKLSVRRIDISDMEISIGENAMWTRCMDNVNIVAFDGTEYIVKLLNENPKKDALNKQINELEAKITEMKKEVNTL